MPVRVRSPATRPPAHRRGIRSRLPATARQERTNFSRNPLAVNPQPWSNTRSEPITRAWLATNCSLGAPTSTCTSSPISSRLRSSAARNTSSCDNSRERNSISWLLPSAIVLRRWTTMVTALESRGAPPEPELLNVPAVIGQETGEQGVHDGHLPALGALLEALIVHGAKVACRCLETGTAGPCAPPARPLRGRAGSSRRHTGYRFRPTTLVPRYSS